MSSSFADILNQMNQQETATKDAFGNDDSNIHKLQVIDPKAVLGREPSAIEQRMMRNIQQVDQYAWNRGKDGGLKTGFSLFDEAIEGGVQAGLILFAAAPNVGKSAFMLQVSKQVSEINENVYVSYHSLDDSNNELLPRYIACDQQITITQAKMPEKYIDNADVLRLRNEGLKNLYRRVNKFGMFDGNDMTSLEAIEAHIKDLLMTLPEGTKLVLAIDSFNDITVETQDFRGDTDAKNTHVAKELKRMVTTYNVPIMCTAHLRKTNGKRPIVDDLKDSIQLQYEANLIVMMYNEVGVREENAQIYWLDDEDEEEAKRPVVEAKFAKNKFGSFKGTRFYEFIPDQSFAMEAPIEACRRYSSLVYQ